MSGLEGRTLDRYQLHRLIGRGGMADVYLGYDPRFEREIAVKVFKREDEAMLRRFVREARLMASLNNPHLVPVYDTGQTMLDGYPQYYIIMPYLAGGSLRTRIRQQGALPLKDVCRYLSEIAGGLDYIHSHGIIHRDIKSSNVLLDEEDHCYLADFGIARTMTESTQLTTTGSVLGTVDYIAPELFEPDGAVSVRSDLYSLGVLLFEMVTGRLPFVGNSQIAVITMHATKAPPSPRSIVPTIPPQVERVILKALEKRPELRYRSAGEMAEAFCNAVAGRGSTAEHAAHSTWGEIPGTATLMPTRQETRLVLPPVPENATRMRQSAPHPAYTGGRQTPVYPQQFYSGTGQQVVPSRQHRPSPERTQGRIVAVIALITLLIVVGPMIYILWKQPFAQNTPVPTQTATSQTSTVATSPTNQPTATPDTTATAQAAAATATQQAQNASATAVAGTTATAQAQASATAGVIQTATAGQPVYQDPLNNPNAPQTTNAQWDQTKNCVFRSDGYHVIIGEGFFQSGLVGCRETGAQYDNATIAANVSIASGHSGGLFFRISTNAVGSYAGYLFEVDTQGNYKIWRSNNFNTGSGNAILQDWTATSALKTGVNAKNRLQVIAHSNSLLFYINGIYLTTIQDAKYTTGDIAFLATTAQGGNTADVTYSNLSIYAAGQ
ncbi:MAG: serine/threonine protein kinase [Ktedonobacteraceae bacterium]|nr:serine/threonine protein kinase [Ktedonobacteraceae bacterium]